MFERLAYSVARFRPATKESIIRWASHTSKIPRAFSRLKPGEEVDRTFVTRNLFGPNYRYRIILSEGGRVRSQDIQIERFLLTKPRPLDEQREQAVDTLSIRTVDWLQRNRRMGRENTEVSYTNGGTGETIALHKYHQARTKSHQISIIEGTTYYSSLEEECAAAREMLAYSARYVRWASRRKPRKY